MILPIDAGKELLEAYAVLCETQAWHTSFVVCGMKLTERRTHVDLTIYATRDGQEMVWYTTAKSLELLAELLRTEVPIPSAHWKVTRYPTKGIGKIDKSGGSG